MRFYKYQGLGNDFVIIEDFAGRFAARYPEFAQKLCDRHFGIGADGLVIINEVAELSSTTADSGSLLVEDDNDQSINVPKFRMRIFNADGSEPEMCGNAIRCVGKHLFDLGLIKSDTVIIATKAGNKVLKLHTNENLVSMVTVDMGMPTWEAKHIPVLSKSEVVLQEPIKVQGQELELSCVSMGNPHAVFLMDLKSYDDLDISYWGPRLEKDDRFPEYTNVEFVTVIDLATIKMKVWERSVGATLACGTGACASAAVTNRLGLTNGNVKVLLPGGELFINVQEQNVLMTGVAVRVFTGLLD